MIEVKDVERSSIVSKNEVQQFKSGLPSTLPCGLTAEGTLASDFLFTGQIKRMIVQKFPYEKYSHPCTASMQVGWPFSSDKPGDGSLLEKYGRVARGKKDFRKILCGVYEAQERFRSQE